MYHPPAPSPDGSFSEKPLDRSSAPIEISDEIYLYALEGLLKGHKPREIRERLLDAGYSKSQTDRIMSYAQDYRQAHGEPIQLDNQSSNAGLRNALIGGGVFLLGVVITIYSMSSANPSNTGIIAYGAIIGGGIQFLRGIFQGINQPLK